MANKKSHVQIGLVDLDGIIRGKFISQEKFESLCEKEGTYCSVLLGWDLRDELYDNDYTNWDTGFFDDAVRVVPNSERRILEEGHSFHLLEFSGDGAEICPRRLAGRVLDRADDMGFEVTSGFEYETFAFKETPESAAEKGYRNLTLLTPSTGGYSILRQNVHCEFFDGLIELSEQLGTPIEGLHPEAGKGAIEFALSPSVGLESPDRAVILKTFSKVWAQLRGISLCYMAKPSSELPGCGGHLHMSLHNAAGYVFYDPDAPDQMSETARYFLGGQQKYMPDLLAMTTPTVNSFTRLTPGFWAPTFASWGFDNRTCALRVVGDSAGSRRIEYRVTSADSNPYLVFAAALASGLNGIAKKIEPTTAIKGNAYATHAEPGLLFARSLGEAANQLNSSKMAQEWFGATFVKHYSGTRQAEEQKYHAHVSDWELERYFEMI